MKRVLLATTALAATAGMAAAEITWGGYGRFGILYDSENKVTRPAVPGTPGTPAMYRKGLVDIDLVMSKEKLKKDTAGKVTGLPSYNELSVLEGDKVPMAMPVTTAPKKLDGSTALTTGTKKVVITYEVREKAGDRDAHEVYATAVYYTEDSKGVMNIESNDAPTDALDATELKELMMGAFGLKAADVAAGFAPTATDHLVKGTKILRTYDMKDSAWTETYRAQVPGEFLPMIPAVAAKPGTPAKMEKRSVRIESRFRINVNASATADNGTVFSAFVRMQADDKADGSAGTMGLSGAKFSVMANGLKLDVGNAGGAIDGMPNYYGAYPNVGLSMWSGQFAAVDYKIQEFASGGAGDNGVNLGWSSGPFSLAVSGRRVAADTTSKKISGSEIAAHIAYSAGNIAFALGHSTSSDMKQESMTVASAKFSSGPVSFTLLAGDEDIKTMLDGDMEAKTSGRFYGASATFAASDAVTVGVNYGSGSGDHDASSYGLGMTYSLGGGVSLKGGVRRTEDPDSTTTVKTAYTMADLGVQFNF